MLMMKFMWFVNGICDFVYVKIFLKDNWYYVNMLENLYVMFYIIFWIIYKF